MRKTQRQKITEMLETLSEAAAETVGLFSRGRFDAALVVLADCQSFALSLGQYIESIAGEGTKTVGLLEEYCNLLYDAGRAAEKQNGSASAVTALSKHLTKLFNSVRSELRPTRLEVVFFPYKASMWDSLESVFHAAQNDPACDAYVVPVPYHICNQKGETVETRCEAADFPSYVPVTDWRAYDLDTRRPDIIFVHNPYDAFNYTTRIHEAYYCEHLRNYTDMLVYIPYFVAFRDVVPELCTLPGTVYAHKVFVQSEQIRRTYVAEQKKWVKANGYQGLITGFEQRFVALGSPKLDKIINSKKQSFTLPDEWSKLALGPGGRPKRKILYNTTINAFLRDEEQYIKKLHSVFNVFRGRDDAVLWWRPHPLLEATNSVMRPQSAAEYRQLVEDYKREGFGIYDDSADLHRAIALTDAYYGDGGSLALMYQYAQKPEMLQRVIMAGSEPPFERLFFNCIYEAFGALWAVSANMNALFKIDSNTWRARYMGSFPGENSYGAWLYTDMLAYGDFLYFPPNYAAKPAVFDCVRNVFVKADRNLCEAVERADKEIGDKSGKFDKLFEAGGRLFMLPRFVPGFLVYDPEKREPRLADEWYKPFEALIINPDATHIYAWTADAERGVVVMAGPAANAIVELDPVSLKTVVRKLGEEKTGYISVVKHGGAYWLLARERASLTQYEPSSGKATVYDIELDGISPHFPMQFQSLLVSGDNLYLMPLKAPGAVRFDLLNKRFYQAEDFPLQKSEAFDTGAGSAPGYRFLNSNTDGAVFVQTHSGRLIQYAPGKGVLREGFVSLDDPEECGALLGALLNGEDIAPANLTECIMREDSYMKTLEVFLDAVSSPEPPAWIAERLKKQSELLQSEIAGFDGGAGRAIYDYCKKAVLNS